jgi:hypothetical protein
MAITESIPLQEKIAELERRIEALEKAQKVTHTTVTRTFYSKATDGIFGKHWDKMWEHFSETMKALWR